MSKQTFIMMDASVKVDMWGNKEIEIEIELSNGRSDKIRITKYMLEQVLNNK